jgi:3-oxoacyl-[acyl-carrier-protein] synthase III
MSKAQVVHVSSYLPERVMYNSELRAEGSFEGDNPFFGGVRERRFASPEYSSVELGARAIERLLQETGVSPLEVDAILCSCVFHDLFWPGIAGGVQHRVGARNANVLNFDTGCSSFLSGLNLANAQIAAGLARRVVVLTVTNFVSRLPEYQQARKSWVLGDGATATLVAAGQGNILASHERSLGEHQGLFRFEPLPVNGACRNYWERGSGPMDVNFSEEMLERIRANALTLVPDAVERVLRAAELALADVDLLVTHQPNRFFLDEWRARIGARPEQCFDTLETCGNLFQGSIPVTLAAALNAGRLRRGDALALGTFSMGGEYVSAMALRW